MNGGDHHRLLVYDQPLLARDFGFTPLVFLQLTKFKCGGLCVGMRWAHILGDAYSASECLNMWTKIMANQIAPPKFLPAPTPITRPNPPPSSVSAVKQLESVGDNWLTPTKSKMQTNTFHISEEQLINLVSRERKESKVVSPFQIISAVVWKSMAKIGGNKIITVCENTKPNHGIELPSNSHQAIGVIEAESASKIANSDPLEIADLIAEKFVDQTSSIEEQMEEGKGTLDFVVYGSNLTFVNSEGADLYGLQLKSRRPIFASLSIEGVGDEGAVVVAADASGGGRIVTAILPEDHLHHLKNELSLDYAIF